MIERKPIIDELVGKIFDHLRSMDRGDVLPWATIEDITGIPKDESHWGSIIVKIKRRMLQEREIELWPVLGVGLRLSTKEEQLHHHSIKRQRRATGQLNRGVAGVLAISPHGLSTHDQIVRSRKAQDMITTRRLIKRNVRQQRIEAKQKVPQLGEVRARMKKMKLEKSQEQEDKAG